ncbi:MAG: dolichyl-phosphate-mannose--protein mannosyltransferase, partial [Bacteroidales bacterium]
KQTISRAVDSFQHKEAIWYYCVTYWFAIAPWSILTFIVILLGCIKGFIKSDIEKLFATVTFCTFIMMSLISSKIVVYLLP